jgi:hypothetical protein
MEEIYKELPALIITILLTIISYYFVYRLMKKENKNFSWDQYFKQCGIYNGSSHWTTIKKYLTMIKQ